MFGYIRINKMELKLREYYTYRGYYCGLCKYLKENFGEISRLSLNYDITFLIILLSSIYELKSIVTRERCIANPIQENLRIINEITEYASNMNIILTYNKLNDNLKDDKRIKDYIYYLGYKHVYNKAYNKYKQKSDYINEKLNELSILEKQKCNSIDEMSNIFGYIMAEIFSYKDDKYKEILKSIGFNIGKYIYILDAYEDLDEDYKKKRYNPFIEYMQKKDELKLKVENLLLMILSFIEGDIEKLNIKNNKGIIDNIIYSGMYLRFKNMLKGSEENEKSI
ncbi:DUF5685 family protein [Tepidibacter formicigenes]|jgi:hypothetical protein|uniref:Uncharacterized protein n=1 Tax=Tepidibacter formicigenes DSM 15518 TaxID=1123349 RepID=A0A1M6NEA8_9FIRM|nr:DUF5685 family protein [Tepidibacter formicigenes]SHJ94040.1 hypothetical protein SAMN02744037_01243 [Tepidibacter formicigenes DSM 15518]